MGIGLKETKEYIKGYDDGINIGRMARQNEILAYLDKEIEHFRNPETVINKAMVYYLQDLKRRLDDDNKDT